MATEVRESAELSPIKQAFLAIQKTEARLRQLERNLTAPIAIVGIGCRFPGGVDGPESYWRLLRNGTDAVTEVPADRWDMDRLYDPDPDAPGKMYARHGAFIDKVDRFDPDFFGISPREAAVIDPQQRLLLECCWEALEHAGLAANRLYGSSTGVFLGFCNSDYMQRLYGERVEIQAQLGTGNTASVAAGRISYQFGFKGPCTAVDTACSSSLVAIHLACQSLRSRECDVALGCGVNLILWPLASMIFSKSRMLARDGRCKTFDAAADGYVRSEGVGVVVLKRLDDALADGDPVVAVICGSATNQDGPSGGLTVPNGPSQQDVIRRALANGNLTPADVTYIEAHGTGTALGDPIEVGALGAVFGSVRSKREPLLLGSVKTNIGHLEGAAGIAGLIKVALMLKQAEIPAHLHFRTPNPHIAWNELPVQVVARRRPWPEGRPRVAGVSSFGFSGTNAHVVLAAAPPARSESDATAEEVVRPSFQLLAMSAKSTAALHELTQRHADYLSSRDLPLADVAYTLADGRSHFNERLAVVAQSPADAAHQFASYASVGHATRVIRARAIQPPPKIAFLFSGHGSQYIGMGREHYETQPVFRQAIEQCHEILGNRLDPPLIELLYAPNSQSPTIDRTACAQPALFAVEYALAQLWMSWGVRPAALLGHGIGEYVAACIAGVFSLEDGLNLVAERGRLIQDLPQVGGMIAVTAEPDSVAAAVRPYGRELAIAAMNSPTEVVVSGAKAALRSLVEELQTAGIRTVELNVSHAFHSPLMEPMVDAFRSLAETVRFSRPQSTLISNVSGKQAGSEIAAANYWCEHLCRPVRFAEGMGALNEVAAELFVEIGPDATLLALARRCLEDRHSPTDERVWAPSLRRGQADSQVTLTSLAELYVRGVNPDWRRVMPFSEHGKVSAPTYPFQRQRCWFELPLQTASLGDDATSTGHALLGRRLLSAAEPVQFQAELRAELPSFLGDHCLGRLPIFPASGYLESAIAAAAHVFGRGPTTPVEVRQLTLDMLLPLPPGQCRTVQTVVTPERSAYRWSFFCLKYSNSAPTWQLHASAILSPTSIDPSKAVHQSDLMSVQRRIDKTIDVGPFYRTLAERGIVYGPRFRAVEQLWLGSGEALARVSMPAAVEDRQASYLLHPVLLDACLQPLALLTCDDPDNPGAKSYLPAGLDRLVWLARLPQNVWSHLQLRSDSSDGANTVTADVRMFADDGQVLAVIEGLKLRVIAPEIARSIESSVEQTPARSHSSTRSTYVRTEKVSAAGAAIAARLKGVDNDQQRPLIVEFLQAEVATVLRRDCHQDVDPTRSFLELGMDSLTGLELHYRILNGLGINLPAEFLLHTTSIDDLAGELHGRHATGTESIGPTSNDFASNSDSGVRPDAVDVASATPGLVGRRPASQAAIKLFCFHRLGTSTSQFETWRELLPSEIDVQAIQRPEHDSRAAEPPCTEFATFIEALLETLLGHFDRPFAFLGFGTGALISYELAQTVRRRMGLSPTCLIVADFWAPDALPTSNVDSPATSITSAIYSEGIEPVGGVLVDPDLTLLRSYRYQSKPPLDCPILAIGATREAAASREILQAWARHTTDCFRMEMLTEAAATTFPNQPQLLQRIARELLG